MPSAVVQAENVPPGFLMLEFGVTKMNFMNRHLPDVITLAEGMREINDAKWVKNEIPNCYELTVHDSKGHNVIAALSLRPAYCDRGHIQLHIEGYLGLDGADGFPRYFFSAKEADTHVREFLKWRLWKARSHPHTLAFLEGDSDNA